MKRQCDKDIYIEKDKAVGRDGTVEITLPRAINPGEIVEIFISDTVNYGYITYYFKIFAFDASTYDNDGKVTSTGINAEVLEFKAGSQIRDQGNGLILSCTVNDYTAETKMLYIGAVPTTSADSMANFDVFEHCTVAFVYKDTGLSSFRANIL